MRQQLLTALSGDRLKDYIRSDSRRLKYNNCT